MRRPNLDLVFAEMWRCVDSDDASDDKEGRHPPKGRPKMGANPRATCCPVGGGQTSEMPPSGANPSNGTMHRQDTRGRHDNDETTMDADHHGNAVSAGE